MRTLSLDTKQQILNFVNFYYANNGYTPTIARISRALNMSDGVIHKYLHRMTDSGELHYDGRHIVTPQIEMVQSNHSATILGNIACGTPISAIQEYGENIILPSSLTNKGNYFILKAKGNSMINVGIEDGDFVVIHQQNFADEGQIVAALIDNESATLKRYTVDRKNKKIVLMPENDKFQPIICDNIHIMGVVAFLLKNMQHS